MGRAVLPVAVMVRWWLKAELRIGFPSTMPLAMLRLKHLARFRRVYGSHRM